MHSGTDPTLRTTAIDNSMISSTNRLLWMSIRRAAYTAYMHCATNGIYLVNLEYSFELVDKTVI